ncbi:MAG: ribonuclease P protein component [Firmicutes bacterium HGW-Firmicutes-14]|jgi:ribonuclease P protein component|nr:MAG: ribonuclease P protein component [Firmicutes bacterium HGW-Firmicutes-14]
MGVINTLKKKEFDNIFKNGRFVVDKMMTFYYLPNGTEKKRIGFSVGKKIGGAVVRNRHKRLMREIYRKHIESMKPGFDCLIVVRAGSLDEDFRTLEKCFLRLVKRAKLLKREMNDLEKTGSNGN